MAERDVDVDQATGPHAEPVRNLVSELRRTVPGWLERCVTATADRQLGTCPPALAEEARTMAADAAPGVLDAVVGAVEADPDDRVGNPLAVLRAAVAHPTRVLRAAGVPPLSRDAFDVERFPDDHYGLSPANWADVDPAVHEPGIHWGAWKAATVLSRRRAEGLR